MKRLLAALAATLLALTITAAPAAAISWYCNDGVTPVTLTVTRVDSGHVKLVTSAPLNSTAYFYAEDNGADGRTAFHSAHDAAGSQVSTTLATALPHRYWIANVADAGQVWYDGGGTRSSCHSPLIYRA